MVTATKADADAEAPASVDNPVLVIESCYSVWLFDVANRRFRRKVKGLGPELSVLTDWRAYDRLVISEESDSFVVFLDDNGARKVRARRHLAVHCARCTSLSDRAAEPLEDAVRLPKQVPIHRVGRGTRSRRLDLATPRGRALTPRR